MEYRDTTGELARKAKVSQPTVRKYAQAGLLDCLVASDGTLLFREGQAERVRKILAERMNNRRRR